MTQNIFAQEIKKRELIYQANHLEESMALLEQGPQCAYVGFDCTARSLHIGSLMPIMLLRRWQQAGHRPIVLFGSATTLVGDPTGKDQSRPLLTREDIEANKQSLKKIFSQFLDTENPVNGAIFVDNVDWWKDMSYMDLLRDIGTHISVNHMLHFETIARRIEQQQLLSFLEFNYMVLQAYDFVYLNKKYGCRYQFGGSDQWGNMMMGTHLAHKMGLEQDLFVLTTPLLTTADGRKMGKTEKGAVWLNPEQLDHFDYWQFWRNVDDRDVKKLLLTMSDLEPQEIDNLIEQNINEAKIRLAQAQTTLCRGQEAAAECLAKAQALFETPSLLKRKEVIEGYVLQEEAILLTELLVKLGACASKGAAKTLVSQKAVKIEDFGVYDVFYKIEKSAIPADGLLIAVGKKHHFKIII